jgi:hypothetical protein
MMFLTKCSVAAFIAIRGRVTSTNGQKARPKHKEPNKNSKGETKL